MSHVTKPCAQTLDLNPKHKPSPNVSCVTWNFMSESCASHDSLMTYRYVTVRYVTWYVIKSESCHVTCHAARHERVTRVTELAQDMAHDITRSWLADERVRYNITRVTYMLYDITPSSLAADVVKDRTRVTYSLEWHNAYVVMALCHSSSWRYVKKT